MECSRKIKRINYAGNEERSTTDGKMECIVEGTDNSKESSLSVSKYRNLYSVNNRLAIVRPPLCSGGNARMSQTLEIGWKLCVKRRTTSLDYESLKTIISILEDERRMKRNAVENEEETKARRDYSRLECSEGNRPSSANFPPEKKEIGVWRKEGERRFGWRSRRAPRSQKIAGASLSRITEKNPIRNTSRWTFRIGARRKLERGRKRIERGQ